MIGSEKYILRAKDATGQWIDITEDNFKDIKLGEYLPLTNHNDMFVMSKYEMRFWSYILGPETFMVWKQLSAAADHDKYMASAFHDELITLCQLKDEEHLFNILDTLEDSCLLRYIKVFDKNSNVNSRNLYFLNRFVPLIPIEKVEMLPEFLYKEYWDFIQKVYHGRNPYIHRESSHQEERKEDKEYTSIADELDSLGTIQKPKNPGFVYIIREDYTGRYKIGKTKKLDARLKLFNVDLPFEVELVHSIHTQNCDETERLLHEHFAHKRVNGEWFDLTEEDIAWIKLGNYTEKINHSINKLKS
ncbi:GIY-YIG nuclease family protein [Aneurinibacillus aneurinilyticus]|uniref:GIY-YIG nuclease family protein n=1 Tax=Aneurinibacillus aneurinilyticus TaxID=1391 RepID=UPI0023F34240|nr:GIY-YIG nuclease family protein [Aneurinibacillus aneurinilyticus]